VGLIYAVSAYKMYAGIDFLYRLSYIYFMPKRKELEKILRKLAKGGGHVVGPHRQGKHEIWRCCKYTFPMPRHKEINERTAKGIVEEYKSHLKKKGV